MRPTIGYVHVLLGTALLVVQLACSRSDGSTGPSGNTGTLSITAAISGGLPLDPAPHLLNIQGRAAIELPHSGTLDIQGTAAGALTVSITVAAINCTVQGSSTRTVTVSPAQTTSETFAVTCTQAPRAGRGHEIAFASFRDEGEGANLYVMNDDGTGLVLLAGGLGQQRGPSWSPDGARIAHWRRTPQGAPVSTQLFVMDSDGSGAVELTSPNDFSISPAWSPAGTVIAFIGGQGTAPGVGIPGTGGIYLTDPDGSNQHRIVASDILASVDWAPDGSRFTGVEVDDGSLVIYNADGTGRVELTSAGNGVAEPSWSPDGSRIAYGASAGGSREIFTINVDGSGVTRLTTSPSGHSADNADWSADGARLVFVRGPDGGTPQEFDLYVMNADGSNVTRLSWGGANDPAWRP